MEESVTLNSEIKHNGLIKKNKTMESCIFTIYDCSNALCIEAIGDYLSPEYCREKIKIIENDLRCLKSWLGLEEK